MKTTVIVTASIGAGHNQAAYAMQEAMLALQPHQQVYVIDLLEEQRIYQTVRFLYLETIRKAPRVFSKAYGWTQNHQTYPRINSLVHQLCYRSLKQMQQSFHPDVFVFTHPFPVLAYRPHVLAPAYAVLTDFGFHSLWLNQQMSGYYVSQPAQTRELIAHGINPCQIHQTGIPIKKGFQSPESGKSPISPSLRKKQILIMGGGLGIGSLNELVDVMADTPSHINIVSVAGKNQALYQQLSAKTQPLPNWEVLGFSHEIPALMRLSSILITKAGAVTLAEAAASGLPSIILNPLPGHEEENASLAERQGWALLADSAEEASLLADHLLQNPDRLHQMREKAQQTAAPHAASAIARHLLDSMLQEGVS